jgi:uncharacterized protein (TIGR03086 family)
VLNEAIDEFGRRVHAVGADQWTSPTPCTEWNVRALVNHVVGELRWIPPLLAEQTIAEVGHRLDGDLLGSDPATTWDDAAREALDAAREPGAGERTVHLSYGDTPAMEYLSELATDVIIHTWDLAHAIGRDEQLDPYLLHFAQRTLEPKVELWRSAGALGAAVDVNADADAQTLFLAMVGRRAS